MKKVCKYNKIIFIEAEFNKKVDSFRTAASDPDSICFAIGKGMGRVSDIDMVIRQADDDMYVDKRQFYKRYPERKHSR
ncbi:hypothetical protein SAMN04487934_11160 [Eubacterium ruminantium]|nr:hypothetical protein SAMN04487934_11160 [Eubacterium ruminantium]